MAEVPINGTYSKATFNTTTDHKFTNYGDMMYSLSVFFTKLSILLLILRAFCSVKRDLGYYLTWILIITNSIFDLLFFFIPIFECSPREKIWNKSLPGHCLDVNVLYLASACFNMISDVAILSVPIYMIWNLQISTQRKMGVSAIFCTGCLARISSIVRLVYIVPLTHTEDYTYHKLQGVLWSMAELAFGLLCSCFVLLPRLYQRIASIKPYTDATTISKTTDADAANSKGGQWVQLHDAKGVVSSDDRAMDDALNGDGQGRSPV